MLGTRQARSLIQAIQSGDSRIATLLDNLPGGKEQADALKRNVARGLAQSMRRTLMNIGGPAASLAQVPGMLENAIFKSMGEKQTVAQEIKAVGDEQNKLLAGTMDQITQSTLASIGELNTKLDGTLQELTKAIQQLDKRRGGAQGANSGDSRLPVGTQPVRGYASGGFVRGPSHGAGGVMANLEGGEYVIPKGYANGGYVDEEKQEAIRKWRMSRKAARDEKLKKQAFRGTPGLNEVPSPGLEGSIADDIDAEIRSPANAKPGGTWSGGITKEQAAQQQKDFKARSTKEKTLFGSTRASRGLDTLGSAFSTLSHGVIGAGQGVIGGVASLFGGGDEYLRESGARLTAAGQHAQNVATLGGRFKHEVSQDAFEQFRGERVEDEALKWAYAGSQFAAEMAPVGAVAKGVGMAAKGASYLGKLGKGARAAVKAKTGARAATKAKGITSTFKKAPEFKKVQAAMQPPTKAKGITSTFKQAPMEAAMIPPTKAKGVAKSAATKLSDDEITAIRSAEATEEALKTNAKIAAARKGGDNAAMLPPGMGGATIGIKKAPSTVVPKTTTTVKRPPLPKERAATIREAQAAKTGVKKKGKGSKGRDKRRAQKPGTLCKSNTRCGGVKV